MAAIPGFAKDKHDWNSFLSMECSLGTIEPFQSLPI
jgi:hypothetical protein